MSDDEPTRDDLRAVADLLPALLRVQERRVDWRVSDRRSAPVIAGRGAPPGLDAGRRSTDAHTVS